MAATPPRPASPVSSPSVVASHALQISPNLEALLEHDELTRRNSGSPTSTFYQHSAEFPVSLPPPPPRKAHAHVGRKTGQREHDATRNKQDAQRKKPSDLWPDAHPPTPPHSAFPSFSRPVTPNPYLNPAPVWNAVSTQPRRDIDDEAQTPKQATKHLTDDTKPESSRPDSRPRPSPSSAFNKVEKFLWIGRDSLSLFSVSGSKRNEPDRRNDRGEGVESDAVQDRQIRQPHVPPAQNTSRPSSRLGDFDTAMSSSPASYHHALQQNSNSQLSESSSTRSPSIYSNSTVASQSSPTHPPRAAPHLLPRLSLPLPAMSHDSPRPKSVYDVTDRDYLSFIDFCSQSTSDLSNIQSREIARTPSPSIYSTSSYNHSAMSLASMKFAPPSPTSLTQQSPQVCSPSESATSVALSSMVFAPPSPSSEQVDRTFLQPFSGPSSPYSPLEFAPPPGSPQQVMDRYTLLPPSDLPSERGRRFRSGKRSISLSPHTVHRFLTPLPPTSNQLAANERADRVRRNRKLARVFGRTPGAEESVTDIESPRVLKKSYPPSLAGLLAKHKNHRHAVSASVAVKSPVTETEPCTPWQTDGLWSPDGRRHSIPLTPGSFTSYMNEEEQRRKGDKKSRRPHHFADLPETASTRSFIDLSDEEAPNDDNASGLSFLVPPSLRSRRIHQSSSTPSLVESLSSEAQAEADKRRKREKLAKLHRCLGSRVPPEAIIENVVGPQPARPQESNPEHRIRGHKNTPLDGFDRGKEELDEKEKALNVRRAQKMEKVFGTPPPQTLFHTRAVPISQPTSPVSVNPYVLTLDLSLNSRNPNKSAYIGKTLHRPGPSDSSTRLLPAIDDMLTPSSFAQSFADSFAESLSGYQQVLAQSSIYLNYQHSLNSLVDIIDRDDRQSLVELHRFLHGGISESPSEDDVTVNSRRGSVATPFKSERRHSLPSKASMSSLSSEFLPSPKLSRFQLRRRRAAKLTHFFGVDYRELIQDILESIEKGVEEERTRGTLQPQEVEVLMHRVRSLRTLKDPFP